MYDLQDHDTPRLWAMPRAMGIDRPSMVIDPIAPRGTVTVLCGGRAEQQTSVAAHLAVTVAARASWAGAVGSLGRVAFFTFVADTFAASAMLSAAARSLGVHEQQAETHVRLFDMTRHAPFAIERMEDGVRRVVECGSFHDMRAQCESADLVVIDGLASGFLGDHSSVRQAGELLRILRRCTSETGPAVIVMAPDCGARGGEHALAAISSNTLKLRNTAAGTYLDHLSNHGGATLPAVLLGPNGRGALAPVKAVAAVEADARAVLEAIRAASAEGKAIPAKRHGSVTVQSVLKRYKELPKRLHGEKGFIPLMEAIAYLIKTGRIALKDRGNPAERFIEIVPCSQESAP